MTVSSNLIVSSATGLLSTTALSVKMTKLYVNCMHAHYALYTIAELVPSVAVSPSAKPSASSIPTPDSCKVI